MALVVDAHPIGQHAWQSVKRFPELHPLHLDDVPGFSDKLGKRASGAFAPTLKTRFHHFLEIAIYENKRMVDRFILTWFLSFGLHGKNLIQLASLANRFE